MADIVKSVEQIDISIPNNSTTASGYLSKGQDYTNCVPFLSISVFSDTLSRDFIDVYFTGTTESGIINFERAEADATYIVEIACSVVEFYPSEVAVQQGEVSSVTNATDAYTTASSFDQDKTAMVFYWNTTSTSTSWTDHLVRGRVLANGTQVDFYRNGSAGTVSGHYYLFEDLNNNFSVSHDFTTTSADRQIPLNFAMDGRQLFLSSWATTSASAYHSRAIWRMFPEVAGFVRVGINSGGFNGYISNQVVTFSGSKTRSLLDLRVDPFGGYNQDVEGATLSGIFTEEVDLDNVSVFSAAPYGLSAMSSSNVVDTNGVFVRSTIDSNGTIHLDKQYAAVSVHPSVINVIAWNGYDTASGTNNSPLDSTKSFVKSVENNTIILEEDIYSVPYVLTKGQDISNCIVLKTESFTGLDGHDSMIANAFFRDDNLLWFRRAATDGTLTISFSIVEFYPDQVSVQQDFFSKSGTNNEDTKIVPVMDLNRTFMISNYSIARIGVFFYISMIRSGIEDSTTLNFYSFGSTTEYPSYITYFLVTDLTGDNFYVDNQMMGASTSTDRDHITDYSFPVNGTIFFNSYAGSYGGDDGDDSLFRSFNVDNVVPVRINKQSAGYNSSVYSAAVHIKKSNRKYTQQIDSYISTTPRSVTIDVDPDFVTYSGALSLVHPSHISANRTSSSQPASLKGSLYRGVIDESAMTCTIASDVSDGYIQYPSFYIVNWLGYGDHSYDFDSVKTGSVVESIELITLSGTWGRIESPLTYGQDISRCVPFATWSTNSNDIIANQFFTFDFFDNPKKVLVHNKTYANLDNSYVEMNLYVLEFGQNIRVQSGNVYLDSSITSLEVDLEMPVVLENTFLLFYQNSDAGGSNGYSWSLNLLAGEISSTSTIQFYRFGSGDALFIKYYIVECFNNEWEVLHKSAASTTSATVIFDVPDLSLRHKSLLLASVDSSYGGDDADDSCFMLYPAFLSQRIQIEKYSAGYNTYNPRCQIITFNSPSFFIDFYTDTFSAGSINSLDHSLGLSVDLKRSIIFNGQAMNRNKTNVISYSNNASTHFKYSLADENTARISKVATTGYVAEVAYQVITFPEYNTHYMEGYVTEEDIYPVARTVRAYRSDTGEPIAETVSASGTGYFKIYTPYSGEHYVVCLDADDLPDYNDLIYGKIYPTVISGSFSHNQGWV